MAPRLFSIEYGLQSVLRKWRSTRKLWYPKEKPVYDAYAFVSSCIEIKKHLTHEQARVFRRRIISEILPNGRLCHLDHEFRTAQSLTEFGWNITHFGFCGDPGPDFVAKRGEIEVEIESKCLSPEIGLGVSYDFAARLMARLNLELQSRHTNSFTTIRIKINGSSQPGGGIDGVKSQILETYKAGHHFSSETLSIEIETTPLEEFFSRFPNFQSEDWLQRTFSEIRTQKGDFGYFIRRSEELIFCNLVSMRTNQQAKKIMKLVSTTCERQFSKRRPALLWLHLQGLAPGQIDSNPEWASAFFQMLARHAFTNNRRDHLASLVFTSDADLDHQSVLYRGRDRRRASAAGHLKGYDNKRCRFGTVQVLSPTLS